MKKLLFALLLLTHCAVYGQIDTSYIFNYCKVYLGDEICESYSCNGIFVINEKSKIIHVLQSDDSGIHMNVKLKIEGKHLLSPYGIEEHGLIYLTSDITSDINKVEIYLDYRDGTYSLIEKSNNRKWICSTEN